MTKAETLEGAERVLGGLRQKREAVVSRIAANADQRKAVGYEVHAADDKTAREKLDKLNAESATLSGEPESLDGAIRTAEERCEAAQLAEAVRAARANAQRLRAELSGIAACTKRLDAAFAAIRDATASRFCRSPPKTRSAPSSVSTLLIGDPFTRAASSGSAF